MDGCRHRERSVQIDGALFIPAIVTAALASAAAAAACGAAVAAVATPAAAPSRVRLSKNDCRVLLRGVSVANKPKQQQQQQQQQ